MKPHPCPKCSRRYRVIKRNVRADGTTVRSGICQQCGTITERRWTAAGEPIGLDEELPEPEVDEDEEEETEAVEPE